MKKWLVRLGVSLVAVAAVTAWLVPAPQKKAQAVRPPVRAIPISVNPGLTGPVGRTWVQMTRTDEATKVTTTVLDYKYDNRGIIYQCGPCPDGVNLGTNMATIQTIHSHYSNPPQAQVGRNLWSVRTQKGWGCFINGDCISDPVHTQQMDVTYGYGFTTLNGAAQYLDGCIPWNPIFGVTFSCWKRDSTVDTPHGHNPAMFYGANQTYVTYEDNDAIEILYPAGDYFQPVYFWPWAYMTVFFNGVLLWDTDWDGYGNGFY